MEPTTKDHPFHALIVAVYFDETHEDPHAEFSRRSGMDRQSAKGQFWRWAYRNPIMRSYARSFAGE